MGEALAYEGEGDWPKAEAWRLEKLLEAGYPVTLAEQIAADSTIDLHRAVAITKHGCPHATAARILL